MADHTPHGQVELGARMDYAEHESTYAMFLGLAKYSAIACSSVLIAMAFGFFGGGGFISSIIVFLLVCALAGYLLR